MIQTHIEHWVLMLKVCSSCDNSWFYLIIFKIYKAIPALIMQINALVVMTQTHIEHWVLIHALVILAILIMVWKFVHLVIILGFIWLFLKYIKLFLHW